MKKTLKNFNDLPYQIELQNQFDKLAESLKDRKNDLKDIDEKIKAKKDYVSYEQLLIWRRQRRAVKNSCNELQAKIDLHICNPLND